MRTVRALARHLLRFEQLEERLPMSASLGSLDAVAAASLNAAKKPTGYSYPVGLTPDDVRTAYGFDNVSFGGIVGDGTGQTIAIINAHSDPTIVNDLAVFDQTFGLPAPPSFTIVNQDGGLKLPKKNRGWSQEIALDVEWSHAIAPGAKILLVEAKNASSFGIAIDYARHVPGVSVISISAAGDEYKSEGYFDSLFTTPVGHAGETFVFASGDEGGIAEYPSSSPNVLSVGGTSLNVDSSGAWQSETVWSDGGGGQSKYEGVPSYQNGLGLTTRGTPDVAYDGDPETGFAVYDSYGSGGWNQFGGTSAGTPQWAALLAIANQGRALLGKGSLANAQAVVYAMPTGDFHDIHIGFNGNPATTGYDLATGLGSPIADHLIPDLVAYNGSTDFTVAAYVATKPTKSHKHLAYNGTDVPLRAPLGVSESNQLTAISLRELLPQSFALNSAQVVNQESSSLIAVASNAVKVGSSQRDVSGGSYAGAIVESSSVQTLATKRVARQTLTGLNSLKAATLLDANAVAGVDAYFATV